MTYVEFANGPSNYDDDIFADFGATRLEAFESFISRRILYKIYTSKRSCHVLLVKFEFPLS